MIEVCSGREVARLIDRVVANPDRFWELEMCVPFIDATMFPRLLEIAVNGPSKGCRFRIVTAQHSASALVEQLPGPTMRWHRTVLARRRLHAKVYLATARGRSGTEAIVTSANLTNGGIRGNIELGVRASPASNAGRRLVRDVRDFMRRLSA